MTRCFFVKLILTFLLLANSAYLPAQESKARYEYTGHLSFDIAKVPFSRNGSYLAFSSLPNEAHANAPAGVYLRSMHDLEHPVFRLELLAGGESVPFQITASPVQLHLQAENGSLDISFPEADEVRFRGQGVSLRLVAVNSPVSYDPNSFTATAADTALAVQYPGNHWEINSAVLEKYMLWPIAGDLHVSAPWNGIKNEHVLAIFSPDSVSRAFEGEIDVYKSVWTPHSVAETFTDSVSRVKNIYDKWLQHMPEVSPEFGPGAELAAYINWASVVSPSGYLKRPAMLMSKNWMSSVWSWDHCFDAMALSNKTSDLAWDEYMLPFDDQDSHGALPDMVRESMAVFNFSKPPIHGWALEWMMRHGGYSDSKHLAEVYGPLSRWTEWYLRYRSTGKDGLLQYNHGNDSGWDNSTLMIPGVPVETPDLDSFLILQMDALSDIARKLGRKSEAERWKSSSDLLLKKMLATLWKGDHFVGVRSADDSQIESDSLMLYLPLILGNRLPRNIQQTLVDRLMEKGKFRTAHGLATEALTSKYYTPEGYWRGPIWAPTTMLLTEGLDYAGQQSLADGLRSDFCRMAQQNGMSENFNAITGSGLRDPAYTWTSSVYLIFAHQLWENHKFQTGP